jgi:large subunit ribosomal protein L10
MRPEKESILAEVRGNVEAADFTILADYRGLTVEQMAALRGRMRENGTRVQVVKNALLRRAAADLGRPVNESSLEGPVCMIWGEGDVTAVAKALKKFAAEFELPVVKGGILGERALSAEDVKAMADMPSREIMLGMFVGTVAAPMTQLAGVMTQKLLSILYVLKAAAEKESGE